MPEWEEIAATACAVENMYLQATAIASEQTQSGGSGVAVYWSSACVRESAAKKDGGSADVRRLLGLDPEGDNGDRCLGLFHVGMAKKEKLAQYRGKRGDVAEKATWI